MEGPLHLKAGCWTGPLWRVSQKTGKVNEERWAEGAPFSTAEAKAAWVGGTLGTWQLSALIQPPPWPMENGMWMRTWGRCILPLGATVQMEVNMHMAIGCSGVHCASPRTTAFKAPAGCSKGTQTHAERWGEKAPQASCRRKHLVAVAGIGLPWAFVLQNTSNMKVNTRAHTHCSPPLPQGSKELKKSVEAEASTRSVSCRTLTVLGKYRWSVPTEALVDEICNIQLQILKRRAKNP